MRKAAGFLLILSGAVLIVSALLLFLSNRREEIAAGEAADRMLEEIRSALAETEFAETELAESQPEEILPGAEMLLESDGTEEKIQTGTDDTETAVQDAVENDATEPRIELEGYEYIGTLCLASIDIEVPVMADWDYTRLNIAPCRQFGSASTGDLVIAGHDYRTHFAKLDEMQKGDPVVFTDAEGKVYEYIVDRIEILAWDKVDAVQNSDAELVLYTCTYTGISRVTVYCEAVTEE